jgi:outer membrane biosynthesis protein TonB
MKLKYYLRGIGIGMLVTALILSISYLNHNKMSDEEVKKRAKELGMVESTSLIEASAVLSSDSGEVAVTTKAPTPEPEKTETPTPTPEPTEEPTPEPTEAPTPEPTKEPTPEPTPEAEAETPEGPEDPDSIGKETTNQGSSSTVTVRINSGDSSVTVARAVEEAGLVASAADFDSFLCANGYDKRLHVGTYEIPYDLTYAEMAKIFVGESN